MSPCKWRRKHIFIGDQRDRNFLKEFLRETGGEFDIIIDDGMHTENSIMTSFVSLFPALNEGGLYVVEDIINMPNIIQYFSDLSKKINYWPEYFLKAEWAMLSHFDQKEIDWLTRNVIGVSIYRYICFVYKGCNPEINKYLMSKEEFYAKKQELRNEVNKIIDLMLIEGTTPTAAEISVRLGNRGLTTINEVLKDRGL